jgi:hypothetical protein
LSRAAHERIAFLDRVAACLRARLELARGVAPRWLAGIGIAGFAATW